MAIKIAGSVIFSAIIAACPLAVFGQDGSSPGAGQWDARVVSAQGDVEIFPGGGASSIAAGPGMPLEQGDRVTAGPGSSAEIGLDGLHLISISENSNFVLKSDGRNSTVLYVSAGGVLAKIQHLLSGQALEVKTPDAVSAVRGTEFGVDIDVSGQTEVGVFDEGRVEVQGSFGGPPAILTPNHETEVSLGGRPEHPHALRHFLRDRARMAVLARRQRTLRSRWRAMPMARRQALRRRMMNRASFRRRGGNFRRPPRGPRRGFGKHKRRPMRKPGRRRYVSPGQ